MNSTESRPLSNAADKATLKAIANKVILSCPGLQDMASEVASELLKQQGIAGLDPDLIYFHRFKAAQSSSRSFTGWQHIREKPHESTTLTQLVIHRFRATDQDNADLLDLYGGFYTAGPEAEDFDETNEVRLHGNDVLKYFWNLDFSSLYTAKLKAFWNTSSVDFQALAKCTFLVKALEANEGGQLSDENLRQVIQATCGPVTSPASLQMLKSDYSITGGSTIRTLDMAGYVANNILRIVGPEGRQILYLPGDTKSFQVLETPMDMHFWVLLQMNRSPTRQTFLSHFSLADRQLISDNIPDIMNRLVSTWGKQDHHLINAKNQIIRGDAFRWLTDSTQAAMFAEASLSLTSNSDLRKKLWIGYLSAGVRVFGPMAVVGWPVALPVIGASLANMGLNIDQAVNGKTRQDRKAGIIGAVLSGIDTLFNLPFLKGTGPLLEASAEVDAEVGEAVQVPDTPQAHPGADTELFDAQAEELIDPRRTAQNNDLTGTSAVESPPQNYKIPILLDEQNLVRTPGKFLGTYRLSSNPSTAIRLNNSEYFVRYEADVNGGGTWAIIDPANPDGFTSSIPVRLNAEGQWELAPRTGLRGGMETPPDGTEGVSSQPDAQAWAQTPGTYVKKLETPGMREWALGGPDEYVTVRNAAGEQVRVSRFAQRQATSRARLIADAERYYQANPASYRARASSPTVIGSQTELFETAFAQKPGLVLGETRGSIGSKQILIENMPELARRGLKTIYLQELLTNANQIDLDTFARTGQMPQDLETYLTTLDLKAGNDPEGKFNVLSLVKAANAQKVRVQAIDCAITYNINGHVNLEPQQQMARSFFASEVIQLNESTRGPGRWIALVDRENLTSFRNYAGISEQTDAVSVRVDDLVPGSAQAITSDPGLALEYSDYPDSPVYNVEEGLNDPGAEQDLVVAQWRVPVETPWAYRPPRALKTLLAKSGMYTFQRSNSTIKLIYRDANAQIAETTLQRMADGQFTLASPVWPDFDFQPFDSLDTLNQRLASKGMKLMGWPAPESPGELSQAGATETVLKGEAQSAATLSEAFTNVAGAPKRTVIPDNWQANELLESMTPESTPGKYQGIYQLDSVPSTAIMLDDKPYYVRYETDLSGAGNWAIIDPEHPTTLSDSIPVRLDSEGNWETLAHSPHEQAER